MSLAFSSIMRMMVSLSLDFSKAEYKSLATLTFSESYGFIKLIGLILCINTSYSASEIVSFKQDNFFWQTESLSFGAMKSFFSLIYSLKPQREQTTQFQGE